MLLLSNKIRKKSLFGAIKVLFWGRGKLEEIFSFVPTAFKEISKPKSVDS